MVIIRFFVNDTCLAKFFLKFPSSGGNFSISYSIMSKLMKKISRTANSHHNLNFIGIDP